MFTKSQLSGRAVNLAGVYPKTLLHKSKKKKKFYLA